MSTKEIAEIIRELKRDEAQINDIGIQLTGLSIEVDIKDIEKLEAIKEKLVCRVNRIKNAIDSLEDNEKEIVTMRLIKNMKWWQIEETTGGSAKNLSRILERALKRINELIGLHYD